MRLQYIGKVVYGMAFCTQPPNEITKNKVLKIKFLFWPKPFFWVLTQTLLRNRVANFLITISSNKKVQRLLKGCLANQSESASLATKMQRALMSMASSCPSLPFTAKQTCTRGLIPVQNKRSVWVAQWVSQVWLGWIRQPELFPLCLGIKGLAPQINHLLVRLTSKVQSHYSVWSDFPQLFSQILKYWHFCYKV